MQLPASHLAGARLMASHHEVTVCDKSVLSVIAYTRLLRRDTLTANNAHIFGAIAALAQPYAARYDELFLLGDLHELERTVDPYRPADPDVRSRAAEAIACERRNGKGPRHAVRRAVGRVGKIGWVLERCL